MDRSKKLQIAAFVVMTFLFWFSSYSFTPYLSSYGNSMTSNSALIGIMMGAYGVAQIILRVPMGIVSDRINNRRIFIQICCFIMFIAALGLFFAPNIYFLIAFRALTGVAVCVWVPMSVLFGSYFEPKQTAAALSILSGCNFAGQLGSSVVTLFISQAYEIRSVFMVSAIAAVIPFILSLFLKDKKLERSSFSFRELLAVGKTKWVLSLSIMAAISMLVAFATSLGFTPELAHALGQPRETMGLVLMVFTSGGVPVSIFASKLFIKPFGARNSLLVMLFLQAVTAMLQPLAQSLVMLYVLIFLNGIARGTCVSLFLGLVIYPFPYEKQAAAMGFYQAVYGAGMLVGPMLAGAVIEAINISVAFLVCGGIGLIAPLLGIFLTTDERKIRLGEYGLIPLQNTSK